MLYDIVRTYLLDSGYACGEPFHLGMVVVRGSHNLGLLRVMKGELRISVRGRIVWKGELADPQIFDKLEDHYRDWILFHSEW